MDTHFNPMMFGLAAVPSSLLPPGIAAIRDQAVREAQAREQDLAHLTIIGVAREEIDDHDGALLSFSQTTVHPNGQIVRTGMTIARRAGARHGTIIPRVIQDWVSEILEPYYWYQSFTGPQFDVDRHAHAVGAAIPTAYRLWAPLIEKYGPLPERASLEDLLLLDLNAAMNPAEKAPRPSWRDGLRRPWYQR